MKKFWLICIIFFSFNKINSNVEKNFIINNFYKTINIIKDLIKNKIPVYVKINIIVIIIIFILTFVLTNLLIITMSKQKINDNNCYEFYQKINLINTLSIIIIYISITAVYFLSFFERYNIKINFTFFYSFILFIGYFIVYYLKIFYCNFLNKYGKLYTNSQSKLLLFFIIIVYILHKYFVIEIFLKNILNKPAYFFLFLLNTFANFFYFKSYKNKKNYIKEILDNDGGIKLEDNDDESLYNISLNEPINIDFLNINKNTILNYDDFLKIITETNFFNSLKINSEGNKINTEDINNIQSIYRDFIRKRMHCFLLYAIINLENNEKYKHYINLGLSCYYKLIKNHSYCTLKNKENHTDCHKKHNTLILNFITSNQQSPLVFGHNNSLEEKLLMDQEENEENINFKTLKYFIKIEDPNNQKNPLYNIKEKTINFNKIKIKNNNDDIFKTLKDNINILKSNKKYKEEESFFCNIFEKLIIY
jgi:hypothetical protein